MVEDVRIGSGDVMRSLITFFLFLSVAACVSAPPMTWQRIDGRPVDGAINQATVECRGEAAQAAAASPAPMIPSTYAIVAAHNQRQDTLDAVMQGCMSKRGYAWVATAKP